MPSRRKDLPPPDDSGTSLDPRDDVLRGRFSIGGAPPVAPIPAHTQSTPRQARSMGRYGQDPAPAPAPRPAPRRKREDPVGMKRASIYISEDASEALDEAVDQILAVLGGGVQKHIVLSALVKKAAASAAEVATDLAQAQAQDLAAKLQRLQEGNG